MVLNTDTNNNLYQIVMVKFNNKTFINCTMAKVFAMKKASLKETYMYVHDETQTSKCQHVRIYLTVDLQ